MKRFHALRQTLTPLLLAVLLLPVPLLLPASSAARASVEGGGETGDYRLLALTFDDGPGPYTETLLDGLGERGVSCTFFLVGSMAARYPELLRRMAEEGHQLGNHSYDHAVLTPENVGWELEGCRQYLAAAAGEESFYVRPPYGTLLDGMAEKLNAPAILWSVDPNDWQTDDAAAVVRSVTEAVKDGDIILLHDSHAHSVQAALEIVDILQAQGYEFVTVRELLRRRGVTPENGGKYFFARNRGTNLPPE